MNITVIWKKNKFAIICFQFSQLLFLCITVLNCNGTDYGNNKETWQSHKHLNILFLDPHKFFLRAHI